MHKEISKILGIAPNSSSSQLFHAKLRLRELIKDYQLRAGLISLLLLLVSSGLLFFYRQDQIMPASDHLSAESLKKKQISEADHTSEPTPPSPTNAIAAIGNDDIDDNDDINDNNGSDDTLPAESTPQSVFSPDSIEVSTPSPAKQENQTRKPLDYRNDIYHDHLFADVPHKATKGKGWSAGISVDPGMMSFNSLSDSDLADNPSSSNPVTPPNPDDEDVPPQAKIPSLANDIESSLGSAPRRHHLPISFALTAEKHFSSWLGLESGIAYSYLHTDFERYKEPTTCHWHYLEIPLKVNLYAYSSPRMKLYFGFGGRVAIPVYSYAQMAPNSNIQSGTFSSKAVWSVGGNVGVAFRLSKRVDLFLEPSLRYHFPQDCKIPNIWTDDEPWSISIPIGFRFNW